MGRHGNEDDLWSFDRVVVGELELQAIGLVAVERIIIHYPDVHKPGIEVLSLDKCDAWW